MLLAVVMQRKVLQHRNTCHETSATPGCKEEKLQDPSESHRDLTEILHAITT